VEYNVRLFITGNMGYIGPVLVETLKRIYPEIEIVGFDSGFFAHSLSGANFNADKGVTVQHYGDVRDIRPEMLDGVDAVIHLAGISNDPMGHEFESVTSQINHLASVHLAGMATKQKVKNFVFASSCSMYGSSGSGSRTEQDRTDPLTAYAKSKIATEESLKDISLLDMNVTCLRFATACGWSPRLRLDLVLNDFVMSAMSTDEIKVLSDGSPWRPLIDVEDMSRAIAWATTRSYDNGGQFLSINVGSNKNNYQVIDLANMVATLLPDVTIKTNPNALPDKRSYSVDFTLYETLAPDFQPQVTLKQSIERLKSGLSRMNVSNDGFDPSKYSRLHVLREHMSKHRMSSDLRWLS